MSNTTIDEVNVKKLTQAQLRLVLETSGFLDNGMVRADWGEYDPTYHQHIYLTMYDDPTNKEGRFIITEVYIDLGPDGKIHADYASCPIGSFLRRENADIVYNLALKEYSLPRKMRHKNIP